MECGGIERESLLPFFNQRRCAPGGWNWIATSMRSSQ
jgi:hypothetical protein